jgi:hypothetical protein
MKFKLEIDCSNAAFGDDHAALCDELQQIISRLQPIADNVFLDGSKTTLRDSNGNRVGEAKFERGE